MSHELLLQWASERGEGTWDDFSAAYRWAEPEHGTAAAFASMRTLSTLGHLEIDWDSGRWAAAPTVLTLLPTAGGHGLVTGARTGALRRHLTDGLSDMPSVFPFFQPQDAAPDACFVACDGVGELADLAAAVGVPFEYSVARRLAAVLPSLDAMLAGRESTPGVRDLGVERLDVDADRWRPIEEDNTPGLYQYERSGRRELRWLDSDARPHRVDFALGAYCELRRVERRDAITWYADTVHGQLAVPLRAPLPVLHARAAAMCSGLAPRCRGRVLLYMNVPRDLAEAIASSLGQQLRVVGANGDR